MADLWRQIQSGDQKAFRNVFDQYYAPLCLYVNKIVHDNQQAEDIVTECFIRIWEKRASIKISHSLKNYLVLTVRNAVFSHLRKPEAKITLELPEEVNEIIVDEEVNVLQHEQFLARLKKAIDKLPDQRKKILEMAAYGNMSYKEIAETLDISLNTVKTQMSRAYRSLKEELTEEQLLLFMILKNL
ncbi:RNA polymerase sigma-70 factor [Puteibacter caeruleilacunae]|nr:RNA polymerase sigma-70 factor [Puteibacter caeruleilacunae]